VIGVESVMKNVSDVENTLLFDEIMVISVLY